MDSAPSEATGWLLDLYAHPTSLDPEKGLVAWLLGDDGVRHRLELPLPLTFYAAGSPARLRQLWRFLRQGSTPVQLQRQERRELFSSQPLTVLAVQVASPGLQRQLFSRVSLAFPDLTYYDSDISLPLHCAARWNVFPLARCRFIPGSPGHPPQLVPLDEPWELDPPAPPLRVLTLEPDVDPKHAAPRQLHIRAAPFSSANETSPACSYCLPLLPAAGGWRPLLVNLSAILHRHDPDLILTSWGDSWLLPYLLERAEALDLPLPLNRDPDCKINHRPGKSYFSYGQVIYRDRQVHLSGRWHIDRRSAMLWDDYTLEGILETARVTGLPVQSAARTSPGTGISSMQVVTALRRGVLVPWRKAEPERFKRAADLFAADQGGLVYQPLTGVHRDVGAIDFISMYPGIMVKFNISPETAGSQAVEQAAQRARTLTCLELPVDENTSSELGLVPQTLAPLLSKRVELKHRLSGLPRCDPRRKLYKARSSAHKWLLVTCFGYLGYRNARFGRIEAHEAVTAYGREALLRAKEAAEDLGFEVLHMYVDGLWVQRADAKKVPDFNALLDSVVASTGLPIALDGIYRWVAFLPSRVDSRVPVPNRYFGVFQDGSLKVRGIEARRRDTPPFIAQAQMEMLEILAKAPDVDSLPQYLPQAVAQLCRRWRELRQGRVPLEQLLTALRLSRELDQYRSPSPAARAARQLQQAGKSVRPGQRVRLLYLRGEPDVHAWDLPEPPDPRRVNIAEYEKLLLRAAESVLTPFGGMKWLNPDPQPRLFSSRLLSPRCALSSIHSS